MAKECPYNSRIAATNRSLHGWNGAILPYYPGVNEGRGAHNDNSARFGDDSCIGGSVADARFTASSRTGGAVHLLPASYAPTPANLGKWDNPPCHASQVPGSKAH